MSNRTLIELNHDYCPQTESAALIFGRGMADFMRSGNTDCLPTGVRFIKSRHHSDPEFQVAAAERLPRKVRE